VLAWFNQLARRKSPAPTRPAEAVCPPEAPQGPPEWLNAFLDRFDAMDRALVAAGFPATSPWWRSRLERFLRTGKKRWVLRVGRRGGKSSTLSRLLTAAKMG
jgi:hypothetical protein